MTARPRSRPTTALAASDERPRASWLLTATVFGALWVFFVFNATLLNDHFDRISRGRQILAYGEVPFRDFVDPGYFLTLYSSAAAQWLFGHALFGEVVFDALLIAAGLTLTFRLASEASGSRSIGLVAMALAVATAPRLYDYDKVFFYPLGVALCWRFIERPSILRAAVIAVGTAIAALYRYDSGLYIACAAIVALVACHRRGAAFPRLAAYAGALALTLLPFIAFLHVTAGLPEAGRQIAAYARREGLRTSMLQPPGFRIDSSKPLLTIDGSNRETVRVRWAVGLSDEARQERERRYRLADATLADGRTWAYLLRDVSPGNLEALVTDPLVEDTAGVDRGRFEPTDASRWWRRLPLRRISVMPGVVTGENQVAWLYWTLVGIPIAALVWSLAGSRFPLHGARLSSAELARIRCAATLCLLGEVFVLRDPIGARIGGVAAPCAVVGAWLVGRWRAADDGTDSAERRVAAAGRLAWPTRWLVRGAVVVWLAATAWSLVWVGDWPWRVVRSGVLLGPSGVVTRASTVLASLTQSPPGLEALFSSQSFGLVQYLRDCTRIEDRVLATWFAPELPYLAGRGFAGGMLVFFGAHWSEPPYQRQTVERLRTQSVPLWVIERRSAEDFRQSYGLVLDYLQANYRYAGTSGFGAAASQESGYEIWVHRRATAPRVHPRWGLPCFG